MNLAAPAETPRLPHQVAHCEALVRAADKERYLAALFAPAACRGALYALLAFNVEIARVREVIREPLAGEIRLQWWSDAIAGNGAGDVQSNPVAGALLAAVAQHRLPRELLIGLIGAHRFDLYNEPMGTLAEFDEYGRATVTALTGLSAHILGEGGAPGLGELAFHAGLAHAIAGLLHAFPIHAARGQLYLPIEVLDRHGARREDIAERRATGELRAALGEMRVKARAHLAQAGRLADDMPAALLPALLPVALARAVLDRMEGGDYDPFAPAEVPQWRKQWRLWRAARRPERIFSA
ncbi:MAG TPA: squalene/phytoene synthase family protein [Xanthobacteraceae bacterium]